MKTTWIVCAIVLSAASVGSAKEPDERAAMLDRIEVLEAEVAAIRAATPLGAMDAQRTAEVRAIVEDVVADADTRASLLDDDVTAGWDDGFVLRSADGDFELELSGQVQVRFVYNHREDPGPREDADQWGFSNRRTKVRFDGHVIDPRLHYTVKFAFFGEFSLVQDANIEYRHGDTTFRVGRFRSLFMREEDISSKRQLLVERSLIAKAFRQLRSTGVAAVYKGDRVRLAGAIMDATPDGALGDDAWLASARAEFVVGEGSLKQLKDMTSFPDADPVTALGFGVLFRDTDKDARLDPDLQQLRWTADLSLEFGGSNVYIAVTGQHSELEGGEHLDQYGVVAQGGVFIDDHNEVFAQYVWGDADGLAEDLSVLSVGLNHYVARHDVKFSFDVGYGLNEVGEFWDSGGAGYDEDAPGQDGQIVMRGQMQIVF